MALTTVDRALLQRCLERRPGAWNDFVDRFLGLVYHTIHHTAHLRSVQLRPEDTEDIAAEVLLQLIANDYAALRQFKGNCSLATYLTVIARRICVHELARRSRQRCNRARSTVVSATVGASSQRRTQSPTSPPFYPGASAGGSPPW